MISQATAAAARHTMWASLSRPRAALLRHFLYAVRRGTSGPPPPLAFGATSRGHVSDASDGDDHRKDAKVEPAPPCRGRRADNRLPASEQKHLYLVFRDTKNGFAIHKVDDDPYGEVAGESGAPGRLPEPPVLRVVHQHIYNFAALGSNIIGIGAGTRQSMYGTRDEGDTLTFDTRTAALDIIPDLPEGVRRYCIETAVPVGNKLYVIENGSPVEWKEDEDDFCMGGLHCLKLDEEQDATKASLKLDGEHDTGGDKASRRSNPSDERWSWWDIFLGCYSSTLWLWSSGPKLLPLSPDGIRAHAVHPGAGAFFVSVRSYYVDDHRGRGTFSYDTESGRWTRHGDWELPFVGRAHYDAGLRAWVGLHGDGEHRPDGCLCACDVPDLGRRGAAAAPGWKLGKEKLFLEDPEQHVDAKLVDMGGGGRFCLVEILLMEAADDSGDWLDGNGDKCLLRLTTFRVKYGDGGELTTTARRPTRSYILPKFWRRSDWQAFCL